MKLVLHHVANPDIGGDGYWNGKPPGPARQVIDVDSLEAASRTLRAWVDMLGLGGGNMARDCGKVTDGRREVARISYNGRAWEPGEWPTKEIKLKP